MKYHNDYITHLSITIAPFHTQSSNLWHCITTASYHTLSSQQIISTTTIVGMFWSSSKNSQHSLNPSKHSLLMTRDSIVFLVKHKLQQCHNDNNALHSTLVLLWWNKTYFYIMSMSLVSNITILWLWPCLGLTRTSPVSNELVAGKERALEMPWQDYCT